MYLQLGERGVFYSLVSLLKHKIAAESVNITFIFPVKQNQYQKNRSFFNLSLVKVGVSFKQFNSLVILSSMLFTCSWRCNTNLRLPKWVQSIYIFMLMFLNGV